MKYIVLIILFIAGSCYSTAQAADAQKCPTSSGDIKEIVSGLINSSTNKFQHSTGTWIKNYFQLLEGGKNREGTKNSDLRKYKLGKTSFKRATSKFPRCDYVITVTSPESREKEHLRVSLQYKK